MAVSRTSSQILSSIFAVSVALAAVPSLSLADKRLSVESLPQPLLNAADCINVNSRGWGWDGQQSCFISSHRIDGAAYPLVNTSSDFGGSALAWSRADFANKTVRCDSYQRSRSDDGSGFTLDRFDITFLTEDPIPASALQETLSDVTAHLYTRGWEIGAFGKLNTGLEINFNSWGYSTESGFILVQKRGNRNTDGEYIVSEFAHCYYRDENTPLRASGYCVDFDGDGIGWNGHESCDVPAVDSNCDYSDAHYGSNRGWGYNTVTGQSCPPAGNTETFVPRDTCSINPASQDGWGWNEARQEACRADE